MQGTNYVLGNIVGCSVPDATPNHLHLIIEINNVGGASGTPHPTNSLIINT